MKASEANGDKRKELAAALRAEREKRGLKVYSLQKAVTENTGIHMHPHSMEGVESGDKSFTIDSLMLYLTGMGMILTISEEESGKVIYNSKQ
jgi:hypothetical protein